MVQQPYQLQPVLHRLPIVEQRATSSTATGLAAASYSVTVTDAGACTAIASATVTQPALLTGTCKRQQCFLQRRESGSARCQPAAALLLTVTPGPAALPQPPAGGLAAGSYTVTVTDSHSCTTNLFLYCHAAFQP